MDDEAETAFERMCWGKRRYVSLKQVQIASQRIREQRDVELRVYNCPFCGSFHLTKLSLEEYVRNQEEKK